MAIPDDILNADADGRIPSGISLSYLAESRDLEAYVAIPVVGGLTLFMIILRCYARIFVVRGFGLDDALAVLTMLPYIALMVLSIILVTMGSGRHIEYIQYVMTRSTMIETEILDFYDHIIYTATLFLGRLSGLAFYYRLARRHSKIRWLINSTAGLFLCCFLPQLFLLIFHCIPVTGQWPYWWQHPEIDQYKCLPWGLVYSVNAGLSLVCDIFMFAIPALLIWVLQADRKRKTVLSFVLFPGIFVIAISSVRIYLVVRGQWAWDGSWFYNPMLILETSEIGGTMICLSLPGLKPLFARWFSALYASYWGSAAESKAKNSDANHSGHSTHSNRQSDSNLSERIRSLGPGGYEMAPSEASGTVIDGESRQRSKTDNNDENMLLTSVSSADEPRITKPDGRVWVKREIKTVMRPPKKPKDQG